MLTIKKGRIKMKILKGADYTDMHESLDGMLGYLSSTFFRQMIRVPLTIVHARSGNHSKNSLHYKGQAVDIRIWGFKGDYIKLYYACLFMCNSMNYFNMSGKFLIVLHTTHIHLQYSERFHNIKGYKAGKYVYPDSKVRAILDKKGVKY